MRLLTAERHWPDARGGAAYTVARFASFPVPAPDCASGLSVAVVASWGRWVAPCGTPGCGGASLAWENDHRVCCVSCGNAGAGWHRVLWPANAELIDAVLAARPIPATRNWQPGEPLESLRAENVAHGLPAGPADPARMQAALGFRRGA